MTSWILLAGKLALDAAIAGVAMWGLHDQIKERTPRVKWTLLAATALAWVLTTWFTWSDHWAAQEDTEWKASISRATAALAAAKGDREHLEVYRELEWRRHAEHVAAGARDFARGVVRSLPSEVVLASRTDAERLELAAEFETKAWPTYDLVVGCFDDTIEAISNEDPKLVVAHDREPTVPWAAVSPRPRDLEVRYATLYNGYRIQVAGIPANQYAEQRSHSLRLRISVRAPNQQSDKIVNILVEMEESSVYQFAPLEKSKTATTLEEPTRDPRYVAAIQSAIQATVSYALSRPPIEEPQESTP